MTRCGYGVSVIVPLSTVSYNEMWLFCRGRGIPELKREGESVWYFGVPVTVPLGLYCWYTRSFERGRG